MLNKSKKISLIIVLFTLLSAVVYAGYCEYKCVFCSMIVVTGCGSPPSSFGYCPRAPDKMHTYVLTRQTR
jgi:hypothetical protein